MQAVYEKFSVICGYHYYQSMWTPEIGELFVCEMEPMNPTDR